MSIAFFDFDKTLLRKESGELIAVPVGIRGLVNPWAGAKFIGLGIGYKMGRVSRREMQYVGYGTYKGGRLEHLIQAIDAAWDRWMKPGLSPAVLARLREHQEHEHGTWVLTASPTYVAKPAQRALGLDGVVGTRMEVRDDGRLTGTPIEPIMEGPEKARVIREVAAARGVDLADCWGYSDSIADVAMLEVVGHPVAVDPDEQLAAIAADRGWEILFHDAPRSMEAPREN